MFKFVKKVEKSKASLHILILIFRKIIKAAEVYLECECTISIEDHKAKNKGCQDGCLNRDLKMECGKDCPLGKLCGNKRFQNVENAPTEVFKTTNKGVGLRATEEILE